MPRQLSDSEISMRYFRQLGLVHQDTVEDLVVLVSGYNTIYPYVLSNLALLGVGIMQGSIHIMVPDRIISKEDIVGQLLFRKEDDGKPLKQTTAKRLRELNEDIDINFVTSPEEINRIAYHRVILLPSDENPDPAKPDFCIPITGQVSNFGAYIGRIPVRVRNFKRNVLTPSLSSLCGGMLSQELLRQTMCIRKTEIVNNWITINFHIRQAGISKKFEPQTITEQGADNSSELGVGEFPMSFRLILGNEPLHAFISQKINDNEYLVRVRIPNNTMFSRIILDSIELVDQLTEKEYKPVTGFVFSPIDGVELIDDTIIEPDIPLPEIISDKKFIIVGAGGLGSWLSAILNISGTQKCTLVIIDHDPEVEEHNLNRQILFDRKSIGMKKADAAREKLREYNEHNIIHSIDQELQSGIVECIRDKATMSREEYDAMVKDMSCKLDESEDEDLKKLMRDSHPVLNLDPVIGHEFKNSDAIVSCLDNMKTRYYLSAISRLTGTPFINAGAQEFRGLVDVYTTDGDCIVCRYGSRVKVDEERVSCTEEGKVPILSIVTTVSSVASIQAALLISKLLNLPKTKKWIGYNGKDNVIVSYFSHTMDNCPEHLDINKIGSETQE